MADTLGSEACMPPPSLSLSYGLSSDIFVDHFEWFFAHPTFVRWSQNRVKWQLHCIGGPGTGKTTLAALVARRLETNFRPHAHITTVYITSETITLGPEFIEDFLLALYQDLGTWEACRDDGTDEDYEEYEEARSDEYGTRVQHRLSLIRGAVHKRLRLLEAKSRLFLIVDGIDRCNSSLRVLLDAELLSLQNVPVSPVSVMITSRIATYEFKEALCDHPAHGAVLGSKPPSLDQPFEACDSGSEEDGDEEGGDDDMRERLELYFTCKTCKHVLCFPCHTAGRICENCLNNDALFEDYDHVNITVETHDDAMKKFIAWDLEREHGDLGLNSTARKPPHSKLGLSFRNNYPGRAQSFADDIEGLALNHIGLAKARLDLVHEAQSVEELMQRRYQLPNNIVRMYDAAIEVVELQDSFRRSLGLKAIAAAGQDMGGLSVLDMQELMHNSIATKSRTGEDIVNAANGFLSVTYFGNPPHILCFHDTFYFFVAQRYSETLYNASQSLQRDAPTAEQSPDAQPVPFFTSPRLESEPFSLSGEPAKVTPEKIKRTVTMAPIPEDAPSRIFVLRQGTRVWR